MYECAGVSKDKGLSPLEDPILAYAKKDDEFRTLLVEKLEQELV